MDTRVIGGLIACAGALTLVIAPRESAATSRLPVEPTTTAEDDGTAMSVQPPPEENHSRTQWRCKGYGAYCRNTQDCCRPYFCTPDRRNGGYSCLR